jgi:hypothetical protein
VGLPPAYGLTVAAVSVAGMGLGAQLVAAFSEAHRYEQIVAAVSKAGIFAGMQTGGLAFLRRSGGTQIIIQCCRRFYSGNWDWELSLSPPFRRRTARRKV